MPDGIDSPHFAYVFERFPSFTQTFCAREVREMEKLGARLAVFSIRDTSGEPHRDQFSGGVLDHVHTLPQGDALVETVDRWKKEGRLPQEAVLTLRHWGDAPDKRRVYEGIYVGGKLAEAGVRHVHTHFAGVGARTCWWIRQFYGIGFSFTGHANDIFEDTDHEVSLARLVKDAACVATVSEYTAGFLKEKYPAARGKVFRAYNGIDLGPFEEASEGAVKSDPPVILSVGRLIEKKGFEDLIRACAILRDRGIAFECRIVGDGPLEESLTKLIADDGLAKQVRLAGPMGQDDIRTELARARVFALPCVTEKNGGKDNLPTVIMEAMAARLPCVSTRLAGVPEMVEDGKTGFLAGEREPERIAGYLEKLLSDPELAGKMGEAGHARAEELFATGQTSRRLLQCLVSCGRIPFDQGLVTRHRALAGSYIRQAFVRIGGLFRRRGPSRFVLAEREAKRLRKQGKVG